MACEGEWGDVVAAGAVTVGACLTVETGIGVALCAAAYWQYIRTVEKLDECLQKAGLASLQPQIDAMRAEAQYLTEVAEGAGEQVQVA